MSSSSHLKILHRKMMLLRVGRDFPVIHLLTAVGDIFILSASIDWLILLSYMSLRILVDVLVLFIIFISVGPFICILSNVDGCGGL